MMRRPGGFSLIELMVVVVIATILAAIAIPTYQSQVRKSRRAEAKTALVDLAGREERLYATQQVYSSSPVALGYVATGGSTAWPVVIGNYYSISNVSSSAPTATSPGTYTLQIAPTAGSVQLKDTSCQLFQVDQTGAYTAQDGSGNNTTSTCWP